MRCGFDFECQTRLTNYDVPKSLNFIVAFHSTVYTYTQRVTNATIRATPGCPPVSFLVQQRDGSASDSKQKHRRFIGASLRPSSDLEGAYVDPPG